MKLPRLLDANANRAREAMRVMEDAARFLLDDAVLSRDIKQLRHDFAAAVKTLPLAGIELHRDTPGDVGTTITTEAEARRGSTAEVVTAAGKRLSESLRCCEEYGKLIAPVFAASIERLRYRGYDLEKRLHQRFGSRRSRQWKLCVILSETLCEHHGWLDIAKASLDAGADCIQLREKGLDDSDLLERATRLCELAEGFRTARRPRPSIILNDRPDIAILAGADGVHLGQGDLPLGRTRTLVGPDLILGSSTHNLTEARRSIAAGADYCGVGAVFATTTKQRKPSGIAYLKKFIAAFPNVPHLAIGGITPDNISQVTEASGRGVAVSSIICGAKKPATVTRKLLRAIPQIP